MIRPVLLSSALLLAAVSAHAQTAPAPAQPPRPPSANDIPLDKALEAAQSAIAACKANGYNVTATIMDKDYGVRLVLRSDGTGDRTVDIGRRKAYPVLKTGMSTGEHAKAIGPIARKPDGTAGDHPSGDPNMIAAAGAFPVKKGGQIVGAFSVSGAPGGDKDEACASPALAKLEASL